MKIAIMSDIHGNHVAFDAVINDIENVKVDHALILGDMITDFPQETKYILETVKNINAYVIRGNREQYIIDNHHGKYGNDWNNFEHYSSLLSTWQQLDKNDIKYLESLPLQMSLEFENNISIRLVHGSPFSQTQGLRKSKPELLRKSANAISESILLCGHAHAPLDEKINNKRIVNVGSVGLNFDGESHAQYTVIEFNKNSFNIEMKTVKYDLAKFKKSCNFDDTWVYLSYKSLEDGINYVSQILKQARQATDKWPIPDDIWNKIFEKWYVSFAI